MTTLYLFCDESGTMPERDQDGPFCAATIGRTGDPPKLKERSGQAQDLAEVLQRLKCIPSVAFVRPAEGYGQALHRKSSKLNTMARATRLMNGANADYFPDRGYNTRNFVWLRCMLTSAGIVIMRAVGTKPIHDISVVLDRKSMAEPLRRLLVDRFRSMAEPLRDPLTRSGYKHNLRFSQDSISVHWSDEVDSKELGDGLFLAHSIGKLAIRALRRGDEATLVRDLSIGKAADLLYDATSHITAPMFRGPINRWRKSTGLPEPLE